MSSWLETRKTFKWRCITNHHFLLSSAAALLTQYIWQPQHYLVFIFCHKQLQITKKKRSSKDVLNQGQVSQVHNEHKSQLELVNTARSINYLRICEALIQIQVIWVCWSTLARTQLGGEFGSLKLVQTPHYIPKSKERWRLRECLELSSKVQTWGIGYCPFEFSLFGFHG